MGGMASCVKWEMRNRSLQNSLLWMSTTRSRKYCEMKYDSTWLVDLTIDCYMKSVKGKVDAV